MDEPERDPLDDGFRSFPRYPAPGRPEQPMPHRPSSWPWVLTVAILTVVTFVGIGALIVVTLLMGLFNQ